MPMCKASLYFCYKARSKIEISHIYFFLTLSELCSHFLWTLFLLQPPSWHRHPFLALSPSSSLSLLAFILSFDSLSLSQSKKETPLPTTLAFSFSPFPPPSLLWFHWCLLQNANTNYILVYQEVDIIVTRRGRLNCDPFIILIMYLKKYFSSWNLEEQS